MGRTVFYILLFHLFFCCFLKISTAQQSESPRFPHQAGIFVNISGNLKFCGGSLVSNRHILTSAQCLDGATNVEVILGAINLSENEPTQKRFVSDDFVIHSGWYPELVSNDLGLIKLSEDVEENDYVQIIRLADSNETYANDMANATGWGLTNDDVLTHAECVILSNADCKKSNAVYNMFITDGLLCLNGTNNAGVCYEDVGGPLVVDEVQVGIAASMDCTGNLPSIFTRVSYFKEWLERNMAE